MLRSPCHSSRPPRPGRIIQGQGPAVRRTPAVQQTTHSPPRSCNRRNPGARARRDRNAKNAMAPGANGTAQSTTKRRARPVIANATLANITNSLPDRIRVAQASNRMAGQTRARRQRRQDRGWAAKCAMAPVANGMAQSATNEKRKATKNDGDAPSSIRIPRDPPHPVCPAASQRQLSPRRLKPPPEPLQLRRARAHLQALAPSPRRQGSQQRRQRPRRGSPVRQHRRSLAARGMQPHARATLQSAPRAAVPSCTCPDRSRPRRLRARSPRRTPSARKVRRGAHERPSARHLSLRRSRESSVSSPHLCGPLSAPCLRSRSRWRYVRALPRCAPGVWRNSVASCSRMSGCFRAPCSPSYPLGSVR